MKQKFINLMLAGLLIASIISCASAPKTAAPSESVAAPTTDITKAKTAAENARNKALEIKADVASKALFTEAETANNAAKGFETSAAPDKAIASYTAAADTYTKAYTDAAAKKDAALKAMNTASDERKTSEDVLTKAAAEQAATNKAEGE